MKFEISNNKLEQVIFRYLDNKNFDVKNGASIPENYYFLDFDFISITFIHSNGTCLISYELFKEIQTFFSLDGSKMIKDIVKKYVEDKLNVEVSRVNVS